MAVTRAVIYLRPGQDGTERQQRASCTLYAIRRQRQVVAIAADEDGGSAGWDDAVRMVKSGDADVIIVPPGVDPPDQVPIEVADGEPPPTEHGTRRTRPT